MRRNKGEENSKHGRWVGGDGWMNGWVDGWMKDLMTSAYISFVVASIIATHDQDTCQHYSFEINWHTNIKFLINNKNKIKETQKKGINAHHLIFMFELKSHNIFILIMLSQTTYPSDHEFYFKLPLNDRYWLFIYIYIYKHFLK